MDMKNRVLELLEEGRGDYVSGQELARRLKVSRNAVWKAIDELRGDGFEISAVTRRGYCLSAESDRLTVPGIRPWLTPETRPGADLIRVYDCLESTNRTAKELAVAGAGHGTVVIAEKQTGGRGRYDHSFSSPAGGLYMSLILRPEKLPFENLAFVTTWAAVAVCEAVEEVTGKKPSVKWINDLLLDGKKICGILTEGVMDFESGSIGWIVLGIGVNVRSKPEDFAVELRPIVGSIDPEGKIPAARCRLAAGIVNRTLGEHIPTQKEILAAYRQRLGMLGKTVTVLRPGEEDFRATATDLNESGHLIVKKEDGSLMALSSGEIHIQL